MTACWDRSLLLIAWFYLTMPLRWLIALALALVCLLPYNLALWVKDAHDAAQPSEAHSTNMCAPQSASQNSSNRLRHEGDHVRRARRGYLMTMDELIGVADPSAWRGQFRALLIEAAHVKLCRRPFFRLWASFFFRLASSTELRVA